MFFPTLTLLDHYLENEEIINKIINRGIIYGYYNPNNYLNFVQPLDKSNSLISLLLFIQNNMIIFIESFFKKLNFFFFRTRPYYSELHNFYIVFFNLLYYPLAIYGFFKFNLKHNFYYYFMIFYIVILSLSVGFTFADWSGRYSIYILPIIFIFSGIGVSNIQKKIKPYFKN